MNTQIKKNWIVVSSNRSLARKCYKALVLREVHFWEQQQRFPVTKLNLNSQDFLFFKKKPQQNIFFL